MKRIIKICRCRMFIDNTSYSKTTQVCFITKMKFKQPSSPPLLLHLYFHQVCYSTGRTTCSMCPKVSSDVTKPRADNPLIFISQEKHLSFFFMFFFCKLPLDTSLTLTFKASSLVSNEAHPLGSRPGHN